MQKVRLALSAAVSDALASSVSVIAPLISIVVEYVGSGGGVVHTLYANTGRMANGQQTAVLNSAMRILTLSPIDFLIADCYNRVIRRFDAAGGSVSTFCGTIKSQNRHGLVMRPRAICTDEKRQNFWIADETRILLFEAVSHSLSVVTGFPKGGFADGPKEVARFSTVNDIRLRPNWDGVQLWVVDNSVNRLRWVDEKRVTHTACGNGKNENVDGIGADARLSTPRSLVFDRTNHSLLYITTGQGIRRFDIDRQQLKTIVLSRPIEHPAGLDITKSGVLIVAAPLSSCLWAVDPTTGEVELLAGDPTIDTRQKVDGDALTVARFERPLGVAVSDIDACVYLIDKDCIRSVSIPLY